MKDTWGTHLDMYRLAAPLAWLPEGWRRNVLLEWDETGILTRVQPDASDCSGIPVADGIVLPGMPNLHSHAFQRAMAGLTEYRSDPTDSFWSWRTLMYAFAQKLTPDALHAVALQLYIEMLQAGYTSVCEFHYIHHDTGGKPFANPAEMAEALVRAAEEAGIGLTLLPVMYQYAGFGQRAPHAGQSRFISSPEWIMDLLARLQRAYPRHAGLRYGVAPHSLRAVSPSALAEVTAALTRQDKHAPVHIHIAEQTQEVDDCVAHFGARPVEWLLSHAEVDARWCLVHATHMTSAETVALARSGAVAGICPTTEANLGDGVFPAVGYASARGAWGIGSDSNVAVCVAEELRMFEYSQRLTRRQRNVLAGADTRSVGAWLYGAALRGGAAAAGRPVGALVPGCRADLLVLDPAHPDLCDRRDDALLDSFVFCQHGASPLRDVMAGGRWVVQDRRHRHDQAAMTAYRVAMRRLLSA